KLRQRGIAGAEIVNRDPQPRLAQHRQDAALKVVLGEESILGDFDDESLGIAARADLAAEVAHEFEIARLLRGNVDADGSLRPERFVDQMHRFQNLLERQIGQVVDEAKLGGEPDELAGRLNDAVRVAQADQRFDTGDLFRAHVDFGLEGAAEGSVAHASRSRCSCAMCTVISRPISELKKAAPPLVSPLMRYIAVSAARRSVS